MPDLARFSRTFADIATRSPVNSRAAGLAGELLCLQVVEPDQLFAMLDGRDLTVDGRTWRIHVYSVSDRAGLRWVQLALDGVSRQMVALKLGANAGARQAIRALRARLVGSDRPRLEPSAHTSATVLQ